MIRSTLPEAFAAVAAGEPLGDDSSRHLAAWALQPTSAEERERRIAELLPAPTTPAARAYLEQRPAPRGWTSLTAEQERALDAYDRRLGDGYDRRAAA